MDKLTTPIHNLSIAKGLVASAVIMTLSSNALAQVRQSHQCLRDGTTRLVQLNTTSDSGVPCEVAYLKPTEGLPDASLWRAMHDADFCRQKYDAFIVKLESKLGWACESTDPAQQRVAAPKVNDDALPVTAQAQSSLDITTKAEPVLPRSAELEAQRKAEADVLAAAELEAQRKAEADVLAAVKLEAQRKAEADALAAAELEAQRKAEADALAAAELEAQRQAEADALAVAELEAQRKIEEDKLALATLAAAKPSAPLENQQPLDPLQDQPASQAAIDTQRAEKARLALNTAPSAALPKSTRGPDAPEKFGL
ncbi:MAG: cell envelope integrity protein TolA, partial [Granulosicoccus sp.]